ncbi:retrovirus-related pol polyprotein from transposon TNT 1-94 [Tanacetum coccineum]
MYGTVPPIPPPLGANTRNAASPNRVDTIPNDNTNNTTINNVAQNVDRFLVYLDGLEPYLLETDLDLAHKGPSDTRDTKIAALRLKFNAFKELEGEKVNGTFTRLKCLLNDLENNGSPFYKLSDTDIEEDTRSNSEFLANLNAEFHDRALLTNQKRFYKRSGRVGSAKKPMDKSNETCFACGKLGHFQKDCPSNKTSTPSYPSSNKTYNKPKFHSNSIPQNNQNIDNHQKDYKGKYKGLKAEIVILTKKIKAMSKGKSEKGLVAESFDWDKESVSFEDEGVTKVKAFMAIAEDEPSVGKTDARSEEKLAQQVQLSKSRVILILNLENESLKDEISGLKKVIEKWTSSKVTLDQLLTEQVPSNIVHALGGRGKRKETISSKEVVFTKADVSPSETGPKITFDSESECDTLVVSEEIKKGVQSLSKANKRLGLDPVNIVVVVKKTLAKLKAQSSQGSSSRKAPMIPKPFIDCKYYGFNDHHSDECEYYPGCDICGSIAHETADCTKKPSSNNRKPRIANQRSTKPTKKHMTGVKQYPHKYSNESGSKLVFGDISLGDTEGYGSVNYNGITFTRVAYVNGLKHNLISISLLCDANFKVLYTKTQGTIFNQNNEVVLIAPRRRDVYVIDMSSYNEESNACFFSKASSTCEKGKHHRASFKTKRSFSISKCLHLLHMDLFGPVKPQTISHNKYTLIIVDAYSRVKELRSNNGTEFRNHKLEEFYDEKGISQKNSSPCTPEQNGVDLSLLKDMGRQPMKSSEEDLLISAISIVPQSSRKDDYFPYVPAYDPLSTTNIDILDHTIPTDSLTLQDINSPKESHEFIIVDDHPVHNEPGDFGLADNLEPDEVQDFIINEPISEVESSPTIISPSVKLFTNLYVPQDRLSR